jgi:hypothetical protein
MPANSELTLTLFNVVDDQSTEIEIDETIRSGLIAGRTIQFEVEKVDKADKLDEVDGSVTRSLPTLSLITSLWQESAELGCNTREIGTGSWVDISINGEIARVGPGGLAEIDKTVDGFEYIQGDTGPFINSIGADPYSPEREAAAVRLMEAHSRYAIERAKAARAESVNAIRDMQAYRDEGGDNSGIDSELANLPAKYLVDTAKGSIVVGARSNDPDAEWDAWPVRPEQLSEFRLGQEYVPLP